MIGRTNAGGGGGLKHVTGSFTSSTTATQNYFDVVGITFEPKFIAIKRNNVNQTEDRNSNPDIYSPIATLFADVDRGFGFATAWMGGTQNNAVVSTPVTITKNGSTLRITVQNTQTGFTVPDMWNEFFFYGNFSYHIYG